MGFGTDFDMGFGIEFDNGFLELSLIMGFWY